VTFDETIALVRFSFDYHGGGSSRLYRLGCSGLRTLKRRHGFTADPWAVRLDPRGKSLYRRLEREYCFSRGRSDGGEEMHAHGVRRSRAAREEHDARCACSAILSRL
jgi:hypothetical protein